MNEFNFDNSDIHLVYNQSRNLPDETLKLWLDNIYKNVPADEINTILDLGCGTGRFSEGLSDYYSAKVYGIDPSEKMLSVAKSSLNNSLLEFLQGSAENKPLEDNSIDLIFLSHVYHHIKDKEKSIEEIKRVLYPNKYFCVRSSTIEQMDSYLYTKYFPTANRIDIERVPSKNELIKYGTHNGFELTNYTNIHQLYAENHIEYYDKISLRGLSDLAATPDDEFKEGLIRLKEFCYKQDLTNPVYEDIGLFTFRLS